MSVAPDWNLALALESPSSTPAMMSMVGAVLGQ